jgi:Na+-driven multidrug efflux pump
MIDGYASVGNILAGKYYGAKEYQSLIILSKKLTKYAIITGVFIAFVGFVFYDFIGQIFTKEPIVLMRFYEVFWIVLLTQPINAITFIFDGMFKGMGKMKYLRNVLIFSTLLAFIPTLLLFDFYNFKLVAIWLAFTFWILARGIPLILKFNKTFISLVNS